MAKKKSILPDTNKMASHSTEARKVNEKFKETMVWSDRELIKLPFAVHSVFDWELNYFPFPKKDMEEDE
eukprot:1347974-Ditylum_brightwellii.AAC.1